MILYFSTLYDYIFKGYCAEYNTLGARIQLHYDLKCSDVKPQCADQYTSTDAYICKSFKQLQIKHFWLYQVNSKTLKSPKSKKPSKFKIHVYWLF